MLVRARIDHVTGPDGCGELDGFGTVPELNVTLPTYPTAALFCPPRIWLLKRVTRRSLRKYVCLGVSGTEHFIYYPRPVLMWLALKASCVPIMQVGNVCLVV